MICIWAVTMDFCFHGTWNFEWLGQNLLQTIGQQQCSSLSSISWPFNGHWLHWHWVKLRHRKKSTVPNQILCKTADLNRRPVQKLESAQIPIDQYSHLRCLCANSWKQCLAWFWIEVCCQKDSKWKTMFESHVETCIDMLWLTRPASILDPTWTRHPFYLLHHLKITSLGHSLQFLSYLMWLKCKQKTNLNHYLDFCPSISLLRLFWENWEIIQLATNNQ